LLLTIQNISELKLQQEALRINSLRALLSEHERIQSLRETLAGAVFQLEGPLNLLSAAANMMERRLNNQSATPAHDNTGILPASALEEAIQKGREALETLRACIPDHNSEVLQSINLNEVLADVLKLSTASLLGSGIVVTWMAADKPAMVSGYSAQLSNLFKHLISNAIDAVNELRGGRRELRLTCSVLADYIEVIVEDSGTGIAEELRYKVFQPFFTTKGTGRQHLGLGLAMAQEVVTRHNGTMDIDPEYKTGCRLRVQLPYAAGGTYV
jgi:nitrogen fixation negative regulator NifL